MQILRCLAPLCAALAWPLANATTYAVTDLGNGNAASLNNRGQVASQIVLGDEHWGCAILDHGTVIPVPTPGSVCSANAINDAGDVVGNFGQSILDLGHGFTVVGGVFTDLGLGPFPGAVWSEATGINALGHVVGDSGSFTDRHGVLSAGASHRVLPVPAARWTQMFTANVNDADQVTGSLEGASGERHAFLYSGGTTTDLGTLEGKGKSVGWHVNEQGQVVGWSDTAAGPTHAFAFDGGAMTDLGVLNEKDAAAQSYARGNNSAGLVVGYSESHRKSLAFTWKAGKMRSVNSQLDPAAQAQWNVYTAQAVNESGQILGWATSTQDAFVHMVLLTPEE